MNLVSIDLDGTPAENAAQIDCAIYLERGEPTGDEYRVVMTLLDATRSELSVRASAADEAAKKATSP